MSTPVDSQDPLVIIIMGVSGCGKSTVARSIAGQLKAHFKDGDALHPAGNIDKMSAGTPLTDEDREPWLEEIARYARDQANQNGICVIACSALKRRYRQTLNMAGRVAYVFLDGSFELIASRMHLRSGHFMPDTLLISQFDTLQDPRKEPNVVTVSIESDAQTITDNAISALRAKQFLPPSSCA